jgi:uncharacterized membrane protein
VSSDAPAIGATSRAQGVVRRLLGAALVLAGIGHLTWQRQEFQAQVPSWLPLDEDLVVVASGVVELVLGAALVFAGSRHRVALGWVTAGFFVAIFPGNIAQYVEGVDAFGLDSDRARLIRLGFQPVLVAVALWSTGAWSAWRSGRTAGRGPTGKGRLPEDE